MSNFINDRIKVFREKAPTEFLLKPDGGLNTCEEWYAKVEAFLRQSLLGMVEELERKLPKAEQQGISEGGDAFNDCLGRIQNLLKSYKQSL